MSSAFRVIENSVNAQHIREYPAATAGRQEDVLHLAVKQYVPLSNANPQPGDLSIIGAHANGFPKELYEALWAEITHRFKAKGIAIRGIWIADVAHQGQSGVANEASVLDYARDLLLMINEFRDQLPRPIVGIGHSMGAVQLYFPPYIQYSIRCHLSNTSYRIALSLLHPRLLQSLVLIESPIAISQGALATIKASTFRKDLWPSRDAARTAMLQNPFYRRWDPRVFDRWIEHGLRDTPTTLHPRAGAVTLATTKSQEVLTYLRPLYEIQRDSSGICKPDKLAYPDLDPTKLAPDSVSYNPGVDFVWHNLPTLRPTALYIVGGASHLGTLELQELRLARTGTGVGGSGGARTGGVGHVTIPKGGHLLPMEVVDRTAIAAVEWLGQQVPAVLEMDREFEKRWDRLNGVEKSMLDERWYKIASSIVAKSKGSKL